MAPFAGSALALLGGLLSVARAELDSRTDNVKTLHGYSPNPPDDAGGFADEDYYVPMIEFTITIACLGLFLLVFHALYRCCIQCRNCCCKGKCCNCIDKQTAGHATAYKFVLLFFIVALSASLMSYTAGELEIQQAIKNIGDALEKLGDLLERLQAIIKDMGRSTAAISQSLDAISCPGGVDVGIDEFADQVGETNSTIASVDKIFDDMIDPIDEMEKQVRTKGARYASLIIPAIVAVPFSVYLGLAILGLISGKVFGHKIQSCFLNCSACWAGTFGLGMALVGFVVLFIFSIVLSDFCYLGPAAILTAETPNNRYVTYYLECVGNNPLAVDVNAMDDAVDTLNRYKKELKEYCTYPDDTMDVIADSIDDLKQSVDDIINDVLSCKYIQPIITDIFYDALCDKTVNGLYYVWIVLVSSSVATYCALLVLPFATAAFRQHHKAAEVAPDKQVAEPVKQQPEEGAYGVVPAQPAEAAEVPGYVAPAEHEEELP